MSSRLSYTWNELFQNIICCVINQNCHYMQWLALCAATCPFLAVQRLAWRFCGYWWSADSRHFRFWVFRYSLWRMLCNYSVVGCDVVHVFGWGRAVFRMWDETCRFSGAGYSWFLTSETKRQIWIRKPLNATFCCEIDFI